MGANTGIEWPHHSWNPWEECTPVSPGCAHCYASARNKRFRGQSYKQGVPRRRTSAANWKLPHRWNRKAASENTQYRVFSGSLCDVFDPEAPDSWRDEMFATIAMTPHLIWMLLTKRPEQALRYLNAPGRVKAWSRAAERLGFGKEGTDAIAMNRCGDAMFAHIWMGVSVENPDTLTRIESLLQIPATVRFLSVEPLLEEVDLPSVWSLCGCSRCDYEWLPNWEFDRCPQCGGDYYLFSGIQSVIVGGESGGKARPMHPDWVRKIRDDCVANSVDFFFKQWGSYCPERYKADGPFMELMNGQTWATGERDFVFPDGLRTVKMSKKRTGRILDGQEWNELPHQVDVT